MVRRVQVKSHALLEAPPQEFAVRAGNGDVGDIEYSLPEDAARLLGPVIVRRFHTDPVENVAGMVNRSAL
jgi:hypothetical protein